MTELAHPSAAPDHPPQGPTGFISTSAAPDWQQGMVMGTGRAGAVVHGDPAEHVLDLTHEEFFLPVNSDRPAPDLRGRLPEIRDALLRGEGPLAGRILAEAAEEASPSGGLTWTDPFVPAAQLRVRDAQAQPVPGSWRREVSFVTGDVTLSWEDEQRGAQRLTVSGEYGTSRIRLQFASEGEGVLEVLVSSGAAWSRPVQPGMPHYTDRVRAAAQITSAAEEGEAVRLEVGAQDPVRETVAETRVHPVQRAVLSQEGQAGQAELRLVPGVEAELLLEVSVRGAPEVAHELSDQQRSASLARADLFGRSHLSLGGAARSAETAEHLLWAARQGSQGAEDGLVELVYAASRHTIISSAGVLPPNLSGVWQGSWGPAWSGDYTLNGNVTLGATASMVSTNMPELRRSLFRLLSRHERDFRENARRVFDAEGFHLPARLATHGHANHFSSDYPHLFWVGCGAWMLRQGWDLFSATGDETLLGWLWGFAKEVMRFYETALIEHEGVLHVVPSYSPENTPQGAETPLAVDATTDVAAIRDAVVVAGRIGCLIGDESSHGRWGRLRDRLPQPVITDQGTLAEWSYPGFEDSPHHRHGSHLYPFGAEGDVLFATEEMRQAALATVRQRLAYRESNPPASMEMAFGLCELGVVAARLGSAELALQAVLSLAKNYWRSSMMSTHDVDDIVNADASGGFPAVIAAMMLTSRPGEVVLLPALPDRWRSGAVTGLGGQEGVIIDELSWDDGTARARLRRRPGSEAAWGSPTLTVRAGAGWTLSGGSSLQHVELGSTPVEVKLHRR